MTEHPDVVLMDVMMPRMDGYTAVGLMKAQMEPAPLILMLTAKGQEGDVVVVCQVAQTTASSSHSCRAS